MDITAATDMAGLGGHAQRNEDSGKSLSSSKLAQWHYYVGHECEAKLEICVAWMQGNDRDYFARMARQVAEQRDQAAFGVLFDFYAPRLNAWLRSQGLGQDEAEELVQEVMTILWNRASLYDPAKASLSTWLFRIARNRRLDAQRRAKGKDTFTDIDWLTLDMEVSDSILLDEEQRDAQVRQALSEIPGEQMELVKAAFFLGKSHNEIAQDTGLPLGTVKSRIRLAFQRLRRTLEDLSVR